MISEILEPRFMEHFKFISYFPKWKLDHVEVLEFHNRNTFSNKPLHVQKNNASVMAG